MAEYPIKFIIVSVTPETIEGIASGIKTLKIIWRFWLPIARAAFTTSGSTSLRALSMTRATKGAAAMLSGTIVATVPMLVPKIKRDKGKSKIIKMIKGNERNTLTTRLMTALSFFLGVMPLGPVMHKRIPKGKPSKVENKVLKTTISKVCNVAFETSVNICITLPPR